MEHKPRIRTMCTGPGNWPQIIVGGSWLDDYGFESGDQVTIINTKPGELKMTRTMAADKWYPIKKIKRLKARAEALKKEAASAFWDSEKKNAEKDLAEVEEILSSMETTTMRA